jgi:hypothetical protein
MSLAKAGSSSLRKTLASRVSTWFALPVSSTRFTEVAERPGHISPMPRIVMSMF